MNISAYLDSYKSNLLSCYVRSVNDRYPTGYPVIVTILVVDERKHMADVSMACWFKSPEGERLDGLYTSQLTIEP